MKLLRMGLLLLLAFAVLSFGAVDVWAQSILEIGSALLLVLWALIVRLNPQLKVRWYSLYWPLLGLIAIGGLQLLFHGTASSFLTRTELLRFACYFVMFFLIAQAFRTRNDWSMLAWFVILFCFAVSLFAIAQHFTSTNEIYWMQRFKTDVRPFGPYVNRNDFAGFVELTLPIGLALLVFRGVHKDLFPILTVLTVIPIGADVLSSSRAGIMSLAAEIAILLLLPFTRSANSRRKRSAGRTILSVVAVAALAFAAWVGVGKTIERFSSLSHPEVTLARRASMARGALRIFFAHPLKGCGLGALVDVFPQYDTGYDGRIVDHVHDDYLELLAEAGILGGLCGLSFLWLFYREARGNFSAEQGHFSRALHGGAIAAVCGMLLHSFVDFNLHIPANALLFLLEVSIVISPPLPSATPARPRRPNAERLSREVPMTR
jgi:O-antigen ligase